MTATTTVAAVLTANQLAYVASAAAKIRKAVTALRGAGLTDESVHVRDLERIAGVLAETVKPAPKAKPSDTPHPVPTARVDTIKGTPQIVKPAVPAPVVKAAASGFHTCGPIVVKGQVVSTPATPEAAVMAAKAPAATVKPAPMAATPKAKPAPKAAKGLPANMASGLDAYRKLQARAKALGVKANGSKESLTARIAAAEVMAKNKPAPKAAKKAAPSAKPEPILALYVLEGGKPRPATIDEIKAVYARMVK